MDDLETQITDEITAIPGFLEQQFGRRSRWNGEVELSQVKLARQMLRNWMKQHPDDYYSQDAGESLAMLEDALEFWKRKKPPRLLRRNGI